MEALFLSMLFVAAFLYASIGHGGASSYLALMALTGIDIMYLRSSALILNLFVAAIAFYNYYKAGYFSLKLLSPFILGSIPMSFLGGMIKVDNSFYKISLGVCLLLVVARMLFNVKRFENDTIVNPNFFLAVIIGAIIGFFSGLIGIGGGVILSPVLIIAGWANIKQSATISAAFIWLNSFSGLLGNINTGIAISSNIYIWVAVALAGGMAGSYLGSRRFSLAGLNYVLASVLLLAGIKLIFV
ncbi:MAG TPA: sulfite exporter TauE/SafE family protein [Bacteroidales bacterium]|nr:sulfite exporter TauE/SafE family protein [Bacteroidales bacterium]